MEILGCGPVSVLYDCGNILHGLYSKFHEVAQQLSKPPASPLLPSRRNSSPHLSTNCPIASKSQHPLRGHSGENRPARLAAQKILERLLACDVPKTTWNKMRQRNLIGRGTCCLETRVQRSLVNPAASSSSPRLDAVTTCSVVGQNKFVQLLKL